MERKLEQSKFHQIFKNLSVGVVECNADGEFYLWSPAAEDLLFEKVDQTSGLGRPRFDFSIFQDEFGNSLSKKRNPFLRPTKNSSPIRGQIISFVNGDQQRRWLQVHLEPSFGKDGSVVASLITFSDITQIKLNQKKITEQQEALALSAQFGANGVLAAGLAHEINNPLAIIKGIALLLIKQLKREPEQEIEYIINQLTKIDNITDRAAGIIQTLRDLYDSKGVTKQETLPLVDVIGKSFHIYQEKIYLEGITVNIDVDPSLKLECRSFEMAQVFFNLIINSVDAMHDSECKQIDISATEEGKFIKIRFSDSGPGIPQNRSKQIFQPFYTTKDPNKGTGLGLSIVHSFVTAHKGVIELGPHDGGAVFDIILPKSQSTPAGIAVNHLKSA